MQVVVARCFSPPFGAGDAETERLARAYDVSLLTVTPEETLANLT